MKILHIYIKNFRAHKEVSFDMTNFSCIIGENNAGKSSLMQAIQHALNGTKLQKSDFYDASEDVVIRMKFYVELAEFDLILDEGQRLRLKSLLDANSCLTLTQTYSSDLTSKMTCTRLLPKEDRWKQVFYDELLKGKRGLEIRDSLEANYPELSDQIESISKNQTTAKDAIATYVTSLSPDQFEVDHFCPIPTGIDASLKTMLPEVIYIEAVKDVSDDVKTTDRATFGKVLGLLLNAIQPHLTTVQETLNDLSKKLNVYTDDQGQIKDIRFSEISQLESLIEKNLAQNFPKTAVKIEIPPPELKTILQSAQIKVDDSGVVDGVETKGDGLKRAILFSIFRSYVELLREPAWNPKISAGGPARSTIILFEEPELYLHPHAQQILFDSLAEISKKFQVIVTTHSPLFFSASRSTSFLKISKRIEVDSTIKPYSQMVSVNFESDISLKDRFQLICYENKNIVFFSNKVVLVEGDSDIAVFKHIAAIIDPLWDFDSGKIKLMKVGGKPAFKKFRDFFKRCSIPTDIICDLDCLVSDFDKLGFNDDSGKIKAAHSLLIQTADKFKEEFMKPDDSAKEAWSLLGKKVLDIVSRAKNGQELSTDDILLLEHLENKVSNNKARLQAIKIKQECREPKAVLISLLRDVGIYVLDKGCLEDYYPEDIGGGSDKNLKAEALIARIKAKEQAMRLCGLVKTKDGTEQNEFEVIFGGIYN